MHALYTPGLSCQANRPYQCETKNRHAPAPSIGVNHSPGAGKRQRAEIICFRNIENRPLLTRVFKELREQEIGGFWNNARSAP
jgi:hypothetical protein